MTKSDYYRAQDIINAMGNLTHTIDRLKSGNSKFTHYVYCEKNGNNLAIPEEINDLITAHIIAVLQQKVDDLIKKFDEL